MTNRWLVALLIATTALSSVPAEAQRMGGRFERSSEAPDNTPPPPPPVFRGNASAPAPAPSAPVFQRQAPSPSSRAPDSAPAPQYQRRGGGNEGGNGGGVWQGRFDNRGRGNRNQGDEGRGNIDQGDQGQNASAPVPAPRATPGDSRWYNRRNPPPQSQPPVANDGRQDGRQDRGQQGDGRNSRGDGRFGRDGGWNGRDRDNDGDWNRDSRRDNRYDNRDNGRDYGRNYDRRDNRRDHRYDGNHDRRWDHGWRNDRRYDWRGYRNNYGDRYRLGRYYAPYRHWNYRRVSIGFSLWPLFYSDHYWINDPWYYRLPAAYGPYRWVRYYGDALLVDTRTGEVVDVINDFFW